MPIGFSRSVFGKVATGSAGVVWDDIYLLNESSHYGYSESSGQGSVGIHVSEDDGTKMYILHTDDKIFQYTLSTAYDIASASYASKTKDLSSEGDIKEGMWISEDGSRVFLVGRTLDTVRSYTMSTPYDISTMSYDSKSLDVSAKDNGPRAIFVSDDGTELYVSGEGGGDIHQYTMSSAYDLATASFTATKDTSGESLNGCHAMQFNRDGSVLIVADNNNYRWQEYNLSTNWDISTASAGTHYIRSWEGAAKGLYITPDGENVYSTASPDADYDFVTQYKLTTGIAFASDSFSSDLKLAVPYAFKETGFSDVAPRINTGLSSPNNNWSGGGPKSRAVMTGSQYKFSDYNGSGEFNQTGEATNGVHATHYPVTFPSAASGSNSYCVEFWIRATDSTSNNNWTLSSGDSGGRWVFGFNTGSSTSFGNENNIGLSNSNWHHVAIVLHSGTKYFYLDGVNQGAWYSTNTGFSTIHVGQFTATAGANFRGQMQDLRIYVGTHKYPSGTSFTPPTQMVTSFG